MNNAQARIRDVHFRIEKRRKGHFRFYPIRRIIQMNKWCEVTGVA